MVVATLAGVAVGSASAVDDASSSSEQSSSSESEVDVDSSAVEVSAGEVSSSPLDEDCWLLEEEPKFHVTSTDKKSVYVDPSRDCNDIRTPASREPPVRAWNAPVERYTFPGPPQSWHASVRVTSTLLVQSDLRVTVICVHQHQHKEYYTRKK